MPSRSTAWCSFMHGLELGGDLLQGPVRRSSLDAGDQPDEPVITTVPPCTPKEIGLEKAFRDKPAHRAA